MPGILASMAVAGKAWHCEAGRHMRMPGVGPNCEYVDEVDEVNGGLWDDEVNGGLREAEAGKPWHCEVGTCITWSTPMLGWRAKA